MEDIEFETPRDDQLEGYGFRRQFSDGSSGDEYAWSTPMYGSAASDTDYQTPREYSDAEGIVAASAAKVTSKRTQQTIQQQSRKSSSSSDKKVPGGNIAGAEADIYFDDYNLLSSAKVSPDKIEEIFSFARHGRCEPMEALLAEGVPVDVRDEHGNTLLAISCQNGNKKIAKCLLRRGACINARNHKGNTPLHFCFHFGYGEGLGQYLIDKGADSSIKNNNGKYCWDGI